MGICFSKKKKSVSAPAPPSPTHEKNQTHTSNVVAPQQRNQPEKVVEETHERKPVFLITPSKEKKQPTAQQPDVEAKVAPVADAKKAKLTVKDVRRDDGLMVVEEARIAPVRTSSCTKEEVESILIQCGRLSRSSSGKGVTEGGGNGGRRYSGSKRSYDFDNESKEGVEGELEKGPSSSRPSPRRRALSRERDGGGEHKRSDSRERGSGGGGRRFSRSPGRRSEGLVSNSNSSMDRSRQPGKMVSVPAREKGNNNINPAAAEDGGVNRKRAPSPSPAVGGVRSSSPRSRSPANIRASNENSHPSQQPPQSLSRSSSKKAEHSPYRRNPMAEIDDNSLRAEQPPSRSNAHSSYNSNTTENQKVSRVDGTRKSSSQSQSQKTRSELRSGGGASEVPKRSNNNSISRGVREQLRTCRVEQQQQLEPEVVEDVEQPKVPPTSKNNVEVLETSNVRTIARTRSSRRSSRDLDALVGFNPETHLAPTSYTFSLLEDINNYHQQTAGFSLPACVTKARSILDAVADLNSSSSDNNKLGSEEADRSSNNQNFCSYGQTKDAFVESEVVVKDDLMEPSLHKYVSVRDNKLRLEIEKMGLEMAPEESAGSNSFVGQPWPSTREPNSVDSSDCCWTSSWSNTGDEVEASDQLSPPPLSDNRLQHQQPQKKHQGSSEAANELPARGRQQRSTSMSNSRKRELDHRQVRRGGAGQAGNGRSD